MGAGPERHRLSEDNKTEETSEKKFPLSCDRCRLFYCSASLWAGGVSTAESAVNRKRTPCPLHAARHAASLLAKGTAAVSVSICHCQCVCCLSVSGCISVSVLRCCLLSTGTGSENKQLCLAAELNLLFSVDVYTSVCVCEDFLC